MNAFSQKPQAMGPTTIAITEDGKYAYVGFHLSDVVVKVSLEDLTIESVADLSEYFPLQCYNVALDASGHKLFVHSASRNKLLILNTQTMSVIHIIDGIDTIGMIRSQYGPVLITWSGGNTVKFVNTETYEVTELMDERIGFLQIQESKFDQGRWYVVTQNTFGITGWIIGIYEYETKAWNTVASFPVEGETPGIIDFKILPNELKAYASSVGGRYPDNHAYGWIYSIDLVKGEVKNIPIDGGALSLEIDPNGQQVYVSSGHPMPYNANNILLINTQSDAIVGSVSLGENSYGWPYCEIRDLQINPTDSRFLYAVSNDANAFVKVDLNSFTLERSLFFNKASFRPHFFSKSLNQTTGYVLIHKSPKAFELDLSKGSINRMVTFPEIRTDAWAYDVASYGNGRLLVAQGESVSEIDANDMRLIGNHWLPEGIGFWHFILSKDQRKIYTISPTNAQVHPNSLLVISTTNFQVEAYIKLEGGPFNYRPYELPEASKLYVLGGQHNGPVVIHVIETNLYTLQKTIIFSEPGLMGIQGTPYYPFAYDSESHTLFVGAADVVLAIDTNNDVIKKVIYLSDVASALGFTVQQPVYVNAISVIFNPKENYLYIIHLDSAIVSIYDLNDHKFIPPVIPMKGFFPWYAFANDDYSKIFCLNNLSDSVSVIDVNSKSLEKVIDLHAGIPPETITIISPLDAQEFTSCSYNNLPTFQWNTNETFKNIEIQFSTQSDFSGNLLKVKGSPIINELLIKPSTWKKVLLLPGIEGGVVYWRVVGVIPDKLKTKVYSNIFAMKIMKSEPTENPEITTTTKTTLPTLSWETNCNRKFKVWFYNDPDFYTDPKKKGVKKKSLSFNILNPNDNEGIFLRELTLGQWTSIRKLVSDLSGSTIYWHVESWDVVNRYKRTQRKDFALTE